MGSRVYRYCHGLTDLCHPILSPIFSLEVGGQLYGGLYYCETTHYYLLFSYILPLQPRPFAAISPFSKVPCHLPSHFDPLNPSGQAEPFISFARITFSVYPILRPLFLALSCLYGV